MFQYTDRDRKLDAIRTDSLLVIDVDSEPCTATITGNTTNLRATLTINVSPIVYSPPLRLISTTERTIAPYSTGSFVPFPGSSSITIFATSEIFKKFWLGSQSLNIERTSIVSLLSAISLCISQGNIELTFLNNHQLIAIQCSCTRSLIGAFLDLLNNLYLACIKSSTELYRLTFEFTYSRSIITLRTSYAETLLKFCRER